MSELCIFVKAIYRDWIASMSGAAGVLLAGIGTFVDAVPGWAFWLMGCACAFVAAFRVWRAEYRAHHNYDQATYDHAVRVLAKLPNAHKCLLKQLCIEKVVNIGTCNGIYELEQTAFVARDAVLPNYRLNPEYANILGILLKDWKGDPDVRW